MKFLNFFKTTLGITILILAVIAIIVIYLNWDTIKGWFSSDSGSGDLRQYNNCIASYAAMNDGDLRAAVIRDAGLDAAQLANNTREQLLISAETICRINFYPRSGSQRAVKGKMCCAQKSDGQGGTYIDYNDCVFVAATRVCPGGYTEAS